MPSRSGHRSYWDTPLNDENYSAPVVKDGRIYVGGNDDTLKCFDAATGELVWSFKARDDIYDVAGGRRGAGLVRQLRR